jgi:hypothetical protein
MDWRTPISYTKRWGKEIEFLDYRRRIGRYLELKGVHARIRGAMGLAAAKVGWETDDKVQWRNLYKVWKHLDASQQNKSRSPRNRRKRQLSLGYHILLNQNRLTALKCQFLLQIKMVSQIQ